MQEVWNFWLICQKETIYSSFTRYLFKLKSAVDLRNFPSLINAAYEVRQRMTYAPCSILNINV